MDMVFDDDNDYSKERSFFDQLMGRYQELPLGDVPFYSSTVWEACNSIFDRLTELGHTDYSQFKLQPQLHRGNGRHYVELTSLRSNTHAALKKMSNDFDLNDPDYLLSTYRKETGTHITQETHQTQSQTTNININLQQLEQLINEKLSTEQLEKIKPLLSDFKDNPTVWTKAQALIEGLLTLGKDVAIATTPAILHYIMTGNW